MSKDFRPWKIDQPQLLPPSVQDLVPKEHLSRFIVELVRESLDLTAITASYRSALGQSAFDQRGIDGYVAIRRAKHPTAGRKVGGPLTGAMRKKIADGAF